MAKVESRLAMSWRNSRADDPTKAPFAIARSQATQASGVCDYERLSAHGIPLALYGLKFLKRLLNAESS